MTYLCRCLLNHNSAYPGMHLLFLGIADGVFRILKDADVKRLFAAEVIRMANDASVRSDAFVQHAVAVTVQNHPEIRTLGHKAGA